jgi:hypothetical protein
MASKTSKLTILWQNRAQWVLLIVDGKDGPEWIYLCRKKPDKKLNKLKWQKCEEDIHGLVKEEHPGPPLDRVKAIVEDVHQKRAGWAGKSRKKHSKALKLGRDKKRSKTMRTHLCWEERSLLDLLETACSLELKIYSEKSKKRAKKAPKGGRGWTVHQSHDDIPVLVRTKPPRWPW